MEDFLTSKTLTPQLDSLPFMTPSFKEELASQDIYTSYQLLARFAQFHFDYEIASKLFTAMDEKFLYILFSKLALMGFEIKLPSEDAAPLKLNNVSSDVNEYSEDSDEYEYEQPNELEKMLSYYFE